MKTKELIMKKSIYILSIFIFSFSQTYSQEESKSGFYYKTASEIIFSGGQMNIEGADVNPVVRFSAFLHFQEQMHYDFGRSVGFFTGIGMRNIGFINLLGDSLRLKQRVYSLGIPLALKIGNLKSGNFIVLGGEAEFFFNYKQKTFLNGRQNKIDKFNEWFSSRTNLFNPSAFVEFHFNKNKYIRLKYYLNDFLVAERQTVKTSKEGLYQKFTPEQSMLFAISFGTTFGKK